MAIANLTGEGTQTEKSHHCSISLTTGIHEQLKYLSAFNIFLSITAVIGNTLILVALRKESSLHPPSKLLLRCLATTDLCVGLIVQPLSVVYWMSLVHEEWNLCRYAYISYVIGGAVMGSVSLLTVTAISVDRLLALLLGLRYRQVVTLKRTFVIVVIFWIMSTFNATSSALGYRLITTWYGRIVIPLCIITSIVSYSKIFLTLRHHQTQVQGHVQQEQPSQINQLNIARYKKAVSSALWVQCTLVACFLPFGVVSGVYKNSQISFFSFLIWTYTGALIYFNSSLNPFLYCWKITELKQAVKQTIREALCCLSS
ncbi:melanocyte-stimulating hormone receptor-like [Oculina patagonica]